MLSLFTGNHTGIHPICRPVPATTGAQESGAPPPLWGRNAASTSYRSAGI